MEKDIFVTKPFLPPMEEYVEEMKGIWEKDWLTNMGPKHQQLEGALKEYMGTKNIALFTNGHIALELSIQAMGLSGEVITTPFTFASTTHAIVRNGLKPVFCDISPTDFTIDADKIESLITEKTSAIVPVHVYGNICNIDKIQDIAERYNLKVIYDAAHAFGEEYNGNSIGNFGDVSMFSFHATKVFNTIEGGAVCYNDPELGIAINRLKNFGIKNETVVDFVGANAKMNEFQAAMGICNLRHMEEILGKRKEKATLYCQLLKDVDGIRLNNSQKNVKSNYAYFPIIVDEKKYGHTRDELSEVLGKNGIHARKYFYPLTNEFECFHGEYNVSETPVAKYISDRVLTLPIYPDLADDDVQRICKIITNISK